MKTFDTTKTFAAKSSVVRAIKAAGGNPDAYTIDFDGNGKYTAVLKADPKKVTPHQHQHATDKKPRNGNCTKVWEIADALVGAKRKDVVAACVLAGIPEGTAKTQYQHWFVSKKG